MQQAITWGNVDTDLCHHMVSLGHNELKQYVLKAMGTFGKSNALICDCSA